MKTRIFWAGILGAVAASTAQAQSSVTLYGRLDASTAYYDRTRASTNRLLRLNTDSGSSSRWGLTGTEDLGGGLSALFNLEAALDLAKGNGITGGANSGTLIAQPATTSFWRRNSYVGLKSARFGQVTLGRNYTAALIGHANIMNALPSGINTGFATATAAQGIGNDYWNSNQIRYDSPNLGGFDFAASMSAGEQGASGNKAGSTIGGLVRYMGGPVAVAASYQRDYDVAGTGKSLSWYMLSGSYKIGEFKVAAGYDAVNNREGRTATAPGGIATFAGTTCPSTPGPATGAVPCPYVGWTDSKMWTVGGSYNVTPLFVVAAQYYAVKETFGGTTSKQTVLNAQYYLSKRTSLYALASHVNNETLALGPIWANGVFSGSNNTLVPNGKNYAFATGIQHIF